MKSKEILVSVIMNCRNGEKFLNEAVNSIYRQTYKNWEIIFFDNQSSDKTRKIIESFSKDHLRSFFDILFISRHSFSIFTYS